MRFQIARQLFLAIVCLVFASAQPAWAAFGDCAPIGTLENFDASFPPQTRTYDARDFRVTDGTAEKTVIKTGAACRQDYSLRQGVPKMSGLEIMRNYAEGLPAMGATITNPKRAGDDDLYATMTKDGTEYWFHIWESNGDSLHVVTVRIAPFKASLAALTDKDCVPVPALQNFAASNPAQTRTYDSRDFRIIEGSDEKTVLKTGAACRQDYSLKPGVGTMSGLEIMRNYAEGLPAMGATITNPKRADDDDIYATMTKDGSEDWLHVWESNGDGLHVVTVRIAPFNPSLAALDALDCAPVPALQNFAVPRPPETKAFGPQDFRVTEGTEETTVTKTGQSCRQDYALKPHVVTMSGLEIMRNYAEALPAMGATITNPKRGDDGDLYATMTNDGIEYWLHVWESNGDGLHSIVLKIAPFHSSLKAVQAGDQPPPAKPAPVDLTLAAPAASPETIAPDQGDFPYLPPVPGSSLTSGKADTAPFYVQPADAKQPELVANGSIVKEYQAPPGMTPAELSRLYHDGLLKAGWTIVSAGAGSAPALTAHYGQNGRNIWALLRLNEGGYAIVVADTTLVASQLVTDLAARCHLALTGVLFDFDKSTLKPESDAVLERVGAMLATASALKLEVQGHTDGKGTDAYNQPLSEARARAVVTWLTHHGVTPNRLTARGYGKTHPVASNDTDEGRARNRRVEIANLACKAN